MDAETGPETQHQVRGETLDHACLNVGLPQCLVEVDDRVVQVSAALLIVAFPARLVLVHSLGCADAKVTHVVLATLLTDLQIGVAVHLRDLALRNARLAMEPVDVLTDDMLKNVAVHQLK